MMGEPPLGAAHPVQETKQDLHPAHLRIKQIRLVRAFKRGTRQPLGNDSFSMRGARGGAEEQAGWQAERQAGSVLTRLLALPRLSYLQLFDFVTGHFTTSADESVGAPSPDP